MEADKTSTLRHALEASLARTMIRALGLLPTDAVSAVGGRLGRSLGPLSKAHRVAARNLAQALPERDARATLAAAWENFGRVMTEYAVLHRLNGGAWRDRIAIGGQGLGALKAAADEGRAALLFSAHLGNWEVVPLALAKAAKPVNIVYRAPNNPAVDALIAGMRAPYAAGLSAKGTDGAREILGHLKGGGLVWMAVDQKMNTGLEIPFFGRGAMTGKAIASLAYRFRCPVFPVRCERTGGCRFRVTVEEPWTFAGAGGEDDIRAALTQINARIEDWIRDRPEQWLWMHKRWPNP